MQVWTYYQVEKQFRGKYGASIPDDTKAIEDMILYRMPSEKQIEKRERAGESITPVEDLIEEVKEEVGATEAPEEAKGSHATFKRDSEGIYAEARTEMGHIKDCATQVKGFFPGITALKARVANKVNPLPDRMLLYRKNEKGKEERIKEPDGYETRFVQIPPRKGKGPASSPKLIDYVRKPIKRFYLQVLDDGVIPLPRMEKILKTIYEYGGDHGEGQERGQGWGKYWLTKFEQVSLTDEEIRKLQEEEA